MLDLCSQCFHFFLLCWAWMLLFLINGQDLFRAYCSLRRMYCSLLIGIFSDYCSLLINGQDLFRAKMYWDLFRAKMYCSLLINGQDLFRAKMYCSLLHALTYYMLDFSLKVPNQNRPLNQNMLALRSITNPPPPPLPLSPHKKDNW